MMSIISKDDQEMLLKGFKQYLHAEDMKQPLTDSAAMVFQFLQSGQAIAISYHS